MAWFDDIIKKLPKAELQIVNDSKTPSGRAHVGSLRGVLIHGGIFRVLQERGIPVKYTFGVDDYDPLDEIPFGLDDFYEKYLGMPLCNVPAPPSSGETDIAKHYIKEFFDIFEELGINIEKYYLRDIYRKGEFNEAIDIILKNVEVVREIYLKVSNSVKSSNWHPFQTVCENCGRIGTTEVTDYDGKEVTYSCRSDLVSWATGCGNKGKISPFDGNGKLPWKLEWTAKWAYRGVTIEGAGKDHNSKGGSRDVAAMSLRKIFHKNSPINIPYGFFKLGGAKMSSSKGIGVSARDMADFLPPEILRYLMLGTQPKRELDFAPTDRYISQLFNGFDKLHSDYYREKLSDYDKQVYRLSEIVNNNNYFTPNFSLIVTLIQLPHINIHEAFEKVKGSPLTDPEKVILDGRIKSAAYWLKNYAEPDEKFKLQDQLPEKAFELNVVQKGFLQNMAKYIKISEWDGNSIQTAIFNAARTTPIKQKDAFNAFYTVLLGKESGPKAGNLISCLERDFIVKRFEELPYDKLEFCKVSGINPKDFEEWIESEREKIENINTSINVENIPNVGIIEFFVFMKDQKTHMKRVLITGDVDSDNEKGPEFLKTYCMEYIKVLNSKYGIGLN